MQFADSFCRGVIRIDEQYFSRIDLKGTNTVSLRPNLAVFNAFSQTTPPREDGYCELSINWIDDYGAIELLFTQKSDNGDYQYKGGVCIVNLASYILLIKNFGHLSYERKKLPGNEYHGNLLMDKERLPDPIKKQIYSFLATSSEHIPNPYTT